MDKKQDAGFDLAEAIRLARTPAGKQLLELFQKNDSEQLRSALEKANSGDFSQAKEAINAFLSTPDAKALLEQIGEIK